MADQQRSVGGRAAAGSLLAIVLLTSSFAASAEFNGSRDKLVCIKRTVSPDAITVVVENRCAYDVTVALTIQAENMEVTPVTSETDTYPAHSQTQAVRLSASAPGKRWNWRYRFDWVKGDCRADHQTDTTYLLPYESGRSHRVIQAYDGKLTHQGQDRYAVDFSMPEGTPVCAARDGVVVDVKESSKVGGPGVKYKDQSNYVSIAHADGTIGEYHHLQYNSVLVEVGRRVEAGAILARSGNTGYSTRPHLHFGVYSPADGKHLQSHPITFTTRQGTIAEPLEGQSYTAK